MSLSIILHTSYSKNIVSHLLHYTLKPLLFSFFIIPQFSFSATLPSNEFEFDLNHLKNAPSFSADTFYEPETDLNFEFIDLQREKIKSLVDQAMYDISLGKHSAAIDTLNKAWDMDNYFPVPGVVLANLYLKINDYTKALETASQLQKYSPLEAEGYTLAGIAHAKLGHKEEVKNAFKQALTLNPGNPDASINYATILLSENKNDDALALLSEALKQHPLRIDLVAKLAKAKFFTETPETTVTFLEDQIIKNPYSAELYALLSRMHLRLNDTQAALKIINIALQYFAKQPDILQLAGVIHTKLGNYSKAADLLETAKSIQPNNYIIRYNLALSYEKLKKIDLALKEIDKSLALAPDHTNSKFVLARLSFLNNNPSQALALLNDIEKINPDNASIPELRANIALSRDQIPEAIGYLQTALSKNPDNPFLAVQLATIQFNSNAEKEGFKTLRDWLNLHPDEFSVSKFLADMLLQQKRYDDAIVAYTKCIEINPNDSQAENNLSWLYLKKGQLGQALKHAQKALELKPDSPHILDTLGQVYYEKGMYEEAIKALKKANTIAPDSTLITFNLARALGKTQPQQAKQILQKLISSQKEFKELEQAKKLLMTL